MKKNYNRLKIGTVQREAEEEKPEVLSPDFKSHGDYCYFHDDLD
jgi:hypothetical protein